MPQDATTPVHTMTSPTSVEGDTLSTLGMCFVCHSLLDLYPKMSRRHFSPHCLGRRTILSRCSCRYTNQAWCSMTTNSHDKISRPHRIRRFTLLRGDDRENTWDIPHIVCIRLMSTSIALSMLHLATLLRLKLMTVPTVSFAFPSAGTRLGWNGLKPFPLAGCSGCLCYISTQNRILTFQLIYAHRNEYN